jgi:hypothetical protein
MRARKKPMRPPSVSQAAGELAHQAVEKARPILLRLSDAERAEIDALIMDLYAVSLIDEEPES